MISTVELFIRVYPGFGLNSIHMDLDKKEFFCRNLQKICKASKNIKTKINIIFDNCSEKFTNEVMNELKSFSGNIEINNYRVHYGSNELTFIFQIKLAASSSANLVGIIEDDYLFSTRSLEEIVSFAVHDKFSSFYTGFFSSDYRQLPMHNYQKTELNFGARRWWPVASTTLTFFSSPKKLKYYLRNFETFGKKNNDYSVWLSITKKFPQPSVGVIFNIYFLKRFLKLFIHTPQFIFQKKSILFVCDPGVMLHLDKRGFSNSHDDMEY